MEFYVYGSGAEIALAQWHRPLGKELVPESQVKKQFTAERSTYPWIESLRKR